MNPGSLIHNFWFIQLIGVVAMLFFIVAFQTKQRRNILTFQTLSMLFFIVQFYLLSATIGAILDAIAVVRNIIFYNKGSRWVKHYFWVYLFAAASVSTLVVFWHGWVSIFPVTAVICGTFALWNDKPNRIRLLMFISSVSWIPYMIAVRSYSGLITQLILSTSVAIAIYRLDRK